MLHNAGLEKELEELEREVSVAKGVVDGIDGERSGTRAEVVGEFEVLEETWRMGVGRALEAEIAGEEVRRAVLERRRVLAGMEMRVGG